MSKSWNPRKPTVQLAPSRIRREPVPVQKIPDPPTAQQEMLGGMAGVVLFAVALAILIVGVSVATIIHSDPGAAARAARFAQCYDAEGSNCVLDGDTVTVEGQKVAIAGISAPKIQGAECDEERSRGIDSAVRLADLLNSGEVTLGATVREPDGQLRRKVLVGGNDVGLAMLSEGMAHEYGSTDGWCDQ